MLNPTDFEEIVLRDDLALNSCSVYCIFLCTFLALLSKISLNDYRSRFHNVSYHIIIYCIELFYIYNELSHCILLFYIHILYTIIYILGHFKSIRGFLSLDGVDSHISGNTNPIVSNERASER